MELILKVNELGFLPYLNSPVDSFIIGLKDFCVNQNYSLSLKELSDSIEQIKESNKKIYLNTNILALEKDIKRLNKIMSKLSLLNIDGFIVSDIGFLNIFKKHNLADKVILDLHTYVTNKYSAKSLLNLGIKRVCIAKEITLDDIKEIAIFSEGNIEVLAQGFYPITYSKRTILDAYYKNFKLNKQSDIHYIKEENRESYYCVTQTNNNLAVYYDKQYSVFPYLKDLIESKVQYFRIDADFLDDSSIRKYISYYKKGIEAIKNNDIKKYNELTIEFGKDNNFETPFMHNKSFLLKEGN